MTAQRRATFAALALVLLVSACAPALTPGDGTTSTAPARGASEPARAVQPSSPPSPAGGQDAAREQAGGASLAQAQQPSDPSLPGTLERLIIRTADVRVSVPDVRLAVGEVERIATLVGGFVFSSSFTESERQEVATVTLRVPPDQKTFQEVLDRLASLEGATMTDRNIRSEDVTEEYTDLEARLRNLQATEARLLALLERATRLEDILALERELTSIRGQIERIEGRKRLLDRRLEQATIVVTLKQLTPGRGPQEWSPLQTIADAWATLLTATQVLATALIWLIVWLPVYGVPLFLLWLLYRRLRPARASGQP